MVCDMQRKTAIVVCSVVVAIVPAAVFLPGVATAPSVTAIYLDNHVPPPAGDTYVRDERIVVWVEFEKNVRVMGTPKVALNIGNQTRYAHYSGVAIWYAVGGRRFVDKDVLSFVYRVKATDRDEDGIGIPANALVLSGSAIKHALGTSDADLSHKAPVPDDPSRKVDGGRIR